MMSLNTGRLIHRSRWTKVKTTDTLIGKVNDMGQGRDRKKQQVIPPESHTLMMIWT